MKLACAILLMLTACGGAVDDGSTDDLNAGKAKSCTSDAQCKAGQVCSTSHKCVAAPDGGVTSSDGGVSGHDGGVGSADAGQPSGGTVGNGGACTAHEQCANGELCTSGACAPMACLHRASTKTGLRASVVITRYQGLQNGTNGTHEIAYGTLENVVWVDVPSVIDTNNVQLALNVHSSIDPAGLPHEIPFTPGEVIELEGEYISGASASAGGNAVIHFAHSTCGYVDIGGTDYQ